ncbi:hypothetical protein VSP10_16485, partial [Myroides odoratimimus]|uniref:hypothetical protein n=1 Tax=Myroides odoratimimus TaxID=76832 RepID=UPI002DBAE53D
RTPGPVTVNGFQDRRIRPLCHFSRGLHYFRIASANILQSLMFASVLKEKNKFFEVCFCN